MNDTDNLRELLPVPTERDLAPETHLRLKATLLDEIAKPAPSRRPRGFRPGALVPALAATAAAVVGVVLIVNGQTGGSVSSVPAAPPAAPAVQLLAQAAAVAGSQPATTVRDDQYVYVDSMVSFADFSGDVAQPLGPPRQRQIWLPVADLCRPGLLRDSGLPGGGKGLSVDSPGVPCPDLGSVNDPTYRLLASLPADPHALLARIYRQTAGHGGADQEAFTTIGDMLRETMAPPQVSAALYRAAALIPGVTLVPDVVDAAGRHGVAVAREDDGIRSEWIFDQKTHQMIGERDVLTRDDPRRGHAGDVVGTTAVLVKAVVDKPGQTS